MSRPASDDLQKLREMLGRATTLVTEHGLPSVLVGVSVPEGQPEFPDVVDFIESELRVEDAIFRLTRERVVLFVADCDQPNAREVMKRILLGYCERSSRLSYPNVTLRYLEVGPRTGALTVKDVLRGLFAPELEAS